MWLLNGEETGPVGGSVSLGFVSFHSGKMLEFQKHINALAKQ